MAVKMEAVKNRDDLALEALASQMLVWQREAIILDRAFDLALERLGVSQADRKVIRESSVEEISSRMLDEESRFSWDQRQKQRLKLLVWGPGGKHPLSRS